MRRAEEQNGQRRIVKAFQPSKRKEEALDEWMDGWKMLLGYKDSETVPRLNQCSSQQFDRFWYCTSNLKLTLVVFRCHQMDMIHSRLYKKSETERKSKGKMHAVTYRQKTVG